MTAAKVRTPTFDEVHAELQKIATGAQTLNRLIASDAKIAQTPKTLIWTLNKAKLYRYVQPALGSLCQGGEHPGAAAAASVAHPGWDLHVSPKEGGMTDAPHCNRGKGEAKRHKLPLLLVFAIMNRPQVLDLRPGHSFVEYMLQHGYDIYLLDWGAPGPEDKDLKFDDYTLEYLPRVIRKMKSVAVCEQFSMLGWCLGALISTMYAVLRPDDGLKNLLLLTAPLDFSDKTAGGFSRWTNDPAFDHDKVVDAFGNVPGELIDYGAKALKPVENFIGTYLGLWDKIDNPKVVESWHAMNTWVRDIIPMAGGAYRQLIHEFYKENRLMQGTLLLRGEHVDLSKLKANVLNVIAERDHITPPCQSLGLMDKIGSQDKELMRVHGGHIGIMAGSGAEKHTWPHIERWLAARSD